MKTMNAISHTRRLFLIGVVTLISLSFIGHAVAVQYQDDLSGTIRNAILADSRSSNMSMDQVNAIVASLTQKAQAQGMTSRDILWRPMLAHTMESADAAAAARENCGSIPGPICSLNKNFGFSGSDITLVVWFGVTVTLILAIIAAFLEMAHHRRSLTQGQGMDVGNQIQ